MMVIVRPLVDNSEYALVPDSQADVSTGGLKTDLMQASQMSGDYINLLSGEHYLIKDFSHSIIRPTLPDGYLPG